MSFDFGAFSQDTLEILHFLSPKRQHIKEGLIPDCSKALLGGGQAYDEMGFGLQSKGLSDNSLHLTSEVIKALIGEPLSEEDLLKVLHCTHVTLLHWCSVCPKRFQKRNGVEGHRGQASCH